MDLSYAVGWLAPLAIQPSQTANHEPWVKPVAIALILLIVLPAAGLLLMTLRSWLTEE